MTFFDRVRFGVSGTPGTGAITVGAAVSGFTTPAGAQPSAIADGTAVQLLAEDGTAWEIFDSVYTVSGTSCSRGTLRASSTGSQLSLTSAAVISVIVAARQIIDKTDFSAAGGLGQVVKQNSAGGAFTVGLPQVSILAYDNTQTSHTGNTSLTTLKTITIPANSMGANGSIRVTIQWGGAGTAGTKTTVLSFGGTTYVSIALGATTIARRDSIQISNRNATNSQIGHASTNAGYAGATTAVITSAIDTTANVTVLIQGQLANSADAISVESYLVELIVP